MENQDLDEDDERYADPWGMSNCELRGCITIVWVIAAILISLLLYLVVVIGVDASA